MKLEFHPSFKSDLESSALYYLEQGGRALADQFIDEVERSIFRIVQNPTASSAEFRDVRRLRLKRFIAYSIRYCFDEGENTVFIGNLLHGARHPETEKDRF